jgi:O-antigen ligase
MQALLDPPASFRWAPYLLVAFVALLPLVGLAETALSLGALTAMVMLLWQRFRGGTRLMRREAWALSTVLFFAYWLPQAISAIDAVDAEHAWKEVLTDLRYLPFLWLATMAVSSERGRRFCLGGIAVIVLLWTLDGLLQAATSSSPMAWAIDHWLAWVHAHFGRSATGGSLGSRETADRLSGVFGTGNLKLGIVLASLSPFALSWARDRGGAWAWTLAAIAIGIVILLAGARAAWLTYGLVLLFSGWSTYRSKRLMALLALAGLLIATLSWFGSANFRERITRSASAVEGDRFDVDHALSWRLSVWSTATRMIVAHPVNGVGARGFRYAYRQYASPKDPFLQGDQTGAFHAHQIVLEILSETGLIGLLLWLSGAALAWRAWNWASDQARQRAGPAALALAVTVFPFNTHLAFYSNFWGGIFLLLVALYAGTLLAQETSDAPAD